MLEKKCGEVEENYIGSDRKKQKSHITGQVGELLNTKNTGGK